MPQPITEEQIYEDLSTCLLLVKRKLALFIKKQEQPQPLPHAPTTLDEETTRSQLELLIKKYKSCSITSHEIVNILSRFMYRIREIVTHITGTLPKHRVYLQVAIRKIELFTLRAINHNNYALTISSLLEIVNNVTQGHQLVISRTTHKNQDKNQQENYPLDAADKEEKCREKVTAGQVSEVQQMLANADKYSAMQLDRDQFRARYFDLKQDEEKIKTEILFRNRYIKQIIQSYERDYTKFKTKPIVTCPNDQKPRFIRRKSQQKVTKDTKQKFPDSPLTGPRPKPKDTFNRHDFNKTFHTMDHNSLERKLNPDTFRSIYEQKLNEKKHAVKVKNMVMIDRQETVSIHSKDANSKKAEFFKKSQEHLRYRYKYYYFKEKNTSSHSIKYKTINPETTINIAIYK